MKKHLLQWCFAAVALVMLAACARTGDSKSASLLSLVPGNTPVVVVGNLRTVVESAGGTLGPDGIGLPPYLKAELSESNLKDLQEINDLLARSGADTEVLALACDATLDNTLIICTLDDPAKFEQTVTGEGFERVSDENGFSVYSHPSERMIIAEKGGNAYFYNGRSKADTSVGYIARFIADASASSFAATDFGREIADCNAVGVALNMSDIMTQELGKNGMPPALQKMYSGVICIKSDIRGEAATVQARYFIPEGTESNLKEFWAGADLSTHISGEAMEYMNDAEFFVGGVVLKNIDWGKFFDTMADAAGMRRSDRAILSVVKGYLENIDGTVAFGLGLDNGMQSIADISKGRDVMGSFSATIVVETKDGKAPRLVDDIRSLLDMANLPYTDTADGLSMTIPQIGGSLYAAAIHRMLVISNRPIGKDNDNPCVAAMPFQNYSNASALVLKRDNPLMRDFGLDYNIFLTGYSDPATFESEGRLQIDGGGNEGVVAKIIKIIIAISKQSRSISARFNDTPAPKCHAGEAEESGDSVACVITE